MKISEKVLNLMADLQNFNPRADRLGEIIEEESETELIEDDLDYVAAARSENGSYRGFQAYMERKGISVR